MNRWAVQSCWTYQSRQHSCWQSLHHEDVANSTLLQWHQDTSGGNRPVSALCPNWVSSLRIRRGLSPHLTSLCRTLKPSRPFRPISFGALLEPSNGMFTAPNHCGQTIPNCLLRLPRHIGRYRAILSHGGWLRRYEPPSMRQRMLPAAHCERTVSGLPRRHGPFLKACILTT